MPRNVSIKNLAEVMVARAARPDSMKPQKVNDRWRTPELSALKIARMRKAVLRAGGEWKWDIPHKEVVKRIPFKGHKRDLLAKEKREEIARCMKRMPQIVAKYREEERERRRKRRLARDASGGLAQLLITPRPYKDVPELNKRGIWTR